METAGENLGKFDVASARQRFPALAQPQVFLDNAGGTQTLDTVINTYVGHSSITSVIIVSDSIPIESPTISPTPMSSLERPMMSLNILPIYTKVVLKLQQPSSTRMWMR